MNQPITILPRLRALVFLCAAVCGCLTVLVPTGLAAGESPEQAVAKAYGPQLAKVRATTDWTDDTALANNMVADAKTMAQDPGLQAAILRKALALSVEDPEGGAMAEDVVIALMEAKAITEEAGWQELVKLAKDALRRRNQGRDDPMFFASFHWQMQLARIQMGYGNGSRAEKELTAFAASLPRDLKYEADQVRQMVARIRFEAPFQNLAAVTRKKVYGGDDLQLDASDDPNLNLLAGETILTQTGDWHDATPYLVRSKDPTWNLILNMHKLRGAANVSPAEIYLPHAMRSKLSRHFALKLAIPPLFATSAPANAVTTPPATAPAPAATDDSGAKKMNRYLPVKPENMSQEKIDAMSELEFEMLRQAIERSMTKEEYAEAIAAQAAGEAEGDANPGALPPATVNAVRLLAAADYLTALVAPAKRPSPIGKTALMQDIAGLLNQAVAADQTGMTAAQKLNLLSRQRDAQSEADKAVADLLAAFDRAARLPWINLTAGNLKTDWSSTEQYQHWKSLPGGILETNGTSWDTMLRTQRVKYADFMLEFDYQNLDDKGHPILFLREHFGPPYYHLEIHSASVYLGFRKDLFSFNRDIVTKTVETKAKEWNTVQVMFDGDHVMVWVNHKITVNVVSPGNRETGTICLIGLDGVTQYRNMRIRELR